MSSIDDAVTAVKNIVIAINNLAKTLSSSFASLSGNNAFTGTNTFLNTVTMTGAAFNEAFATIASAATTNIGAAAGNYLQVTGVTTITAFGTVQAGTQRTLEFAGILTLTHNATSLILPGGASIVTAAGDTAIFRSEGSGNWRCISYSPAAGPLIGMRNRIINGDMRIDQRNVSTAITPAATVYTVDRFQAPLSPNGKLTFQQVATQLAAGFPNSMKITVAVQYSPAAGEVLLFGQAIEGVNVSDLAWGTASAKTITISFWVQSSITGLYSVGLINFTSTRSYIASFTIVSVSTPQFVTLTIPGETTGTWNTDTSAGIIVYFNLGCGSTYVTAAGVWTAAQKYAATGGVVFVNQIVGSTFFVTGLQLEAQPFATAFERRSFGLEMELCQRYYQKSYRAADRPGTVQPSVAGSLLGNSDSGNVIRLGSNLPTRMRVLPTAVAYSYATGAAGNMRNDSTGADVAVAGILGMETVVVVIANFAGPAQQGQLAYTLDAEM